MNVPFVDLKAQYASIKTEIDAAMADVVANTAFIGGQRLKDFERDFASFCTVKYCIGCGNGTDAIAIALRATGVGTGDKVCVPANSFVATSEAATMAGAEPVFVDVDPDTYCIDTAALRKTLEADRAGQGAIKAVVPVHLYGAMGDMDAVMALAGEFGLVVVEDCAQAHGATYKGRQAGSIGHFGCFSFYPGKNLGAYGDGGAMVTNDEKLATKARMIANHGRIAKYDHEFEGVNSRLDGLQAAVLGVKLKHLPQWNEARLAAAKRYNRLLQGVNGLALPVIDDGDGMRQVFHLYVVRTANRDDVMAYLRENGVGCGIHYPMALPNLTAYAHQGHKPEDFPVSSRYQNEMISLPMFPELTDEQAEKVACTLKEALAR